MEELELFTVNVYQVHDSKGQHNNNSNDNEQRLDNDMIPIEEYPNMMSARVIKVSVILNEYL